MTDVYRMNNRLVLRFSTSENSLANWASAAIRRLTHSKFSHVDFLLPDGNLLGASDQGPKSPFIVGNPQGVAIRPAGYQRFGIRRDMILSTDKADDIIAVAMRELGKPFDSSALWCFLNDGAVDPEPRDWRNTDAWFCAEHKIFSFELGSYFPRPLRIHKDRVTPADIQLLLIQDERWINYDTFDNPIEGLALDPGER